MKLGIVFPGQGSQSVGMLAALSAAEPAVRSTFDEASQVLGYDLWQLCQDGPVEDLNATERTQPAMLAAGVAVFRVWQARGGAAPALMAGHSLGEFTALVCAGAIDFAAAVDLVRFRGQSMQSAVPLGTGAMAAILGLEDAVVEACCAEVADGAVVQPVNYNSPGQLVIAGEAAAVARAIESCKARGAKRAMLLPVSVPSHSSLMRPAAEQLSERLAGMAIRKPGVEVYAFDVGRHDSPEAIRDGLYRQLFNPVRWSAAVAEMIRGGMTHAVECGPGKVLAGLVKRAEGGRAVNVFAVDDPASMDAALAGCREA
ncbi:MAG: ACP S-malonyltransferase [Gammaproteobacteria bacterium]|nr:ACP S-malonyltransferase [Gammaproteobacteria bacterium]